MLQKQKVNFSVKFLEPYAVKKSMLTSYKLLLGFLTTYLNFIMWSW